MKSIVIGLVLIFQVIACYAQSDSVRYETNPAEIDFYYRELYNFRPGSTFGPLIPNPPALQQKFDLSQSLVIDFSTFPSYKTVSLSTHFPAFHPFINAVSVHNFAEYSLGNRLKYGGTGYSANSVFNPFPLNPEFKNMNMRGVSMFLEYKVSKNVRIGGSIHVNSQQGLY